MPDLEIAITHDHLVQRGGAERVVAAIARAFPGAPIYTTLYEPDETYPELRQLDIRPSWLNRFSVLRKSHRLTLPLLASVVGSTRVNATVTIASSAGWSHGYDTSGPKIVYCYSPARWLYQTDAYLGSDKLTIKRMLLLALSPFLKRWDKKKALTATKYFAISTAVQQRIRDAYGIESEVLPAPHTIDSSLPQDPVDISAVRRPSEEFYLCICRLLPYKNVDVVIEAMNSLNIPLIVVGAGPEEDNLQRLAGPSVLMLKNLSDNQVRWLYAHCTAVLSASYEDFGLTPIEGAAYGKPSIVLRWGGFLDTIREGQTGLYFDSPTPEEVRNAIVLSRQRAWDSELIRGHAELFSEEHFAGRLIEEVARLAE
ncbi:glycosyltransferase [Mycolicibacterium aichiense]|uniref:Glycosyl transferase n=1 Tax=Mycolicibacterium aichiense TaxID=1799 RepID=A0AAD1HQG3_9MYCO|nr:glycosyltransferase [Mycolicibacterium aichiense]MCV7016389.1 glycosyltransferase [Mycolicibacterium aichiense]BBX09837.1 glycosyl transferase [Mycolicibacterium aichiense]SUA14399.1 glycosyl transferase [Mycolicibacterium aichiense]